MIIIGTDEALKGDTFGGIIVAGVKCDDKKREALMTIGVRDSKKLTDNKVKQLATKIKNLTEHKVISLTPEEYNKEITASNIRNLEMSYTKRKTMTFLLNELHNKIISELGKADKIIVDQYPGCTLPSETKAESKYIEVAAASIIARAEGLKQLDKLSKKAGFKIPKGSTHVKEALITAKNKNLELKKYAKMNFKNVNQA